MSERDHPELPLEPGEAHDEKQIDYWSMLVRRRRWLLTPFFSLGLLTFTVARNWPFLYRSEALVIVDQQKVSERYVTPNILVNLQNRLEHLKQQVLGRTRLQQLITQLNLYPKERERLPMDEVIDKMRERISVELVQTQGRQGDVAGFRIYYSYPDPRTAQRVNGELTSSFIDGNLRARSEQVTGTTAFLESELQDARATLAQREAIVRDYKARYGDELPEQQVNNLQILSSLETQLRGTASALDRAQQQKVYLESLRTQYQALAGRLSSAQEAGAPLVSTAQRAIETQLAEARFKLSGLRTRYTATHPEVTELQKQIDEMEKIQAASNPEQPAASNPRPLVSGRDAPTEMGMIEIDSRLKALGLEIANLELEVKNLEERIEGYRRRLSLSPVRAQQLADYVRSLENARALHESLLTRKHESELASNLEKRLQGERFTVLDPPTLPERPEGRLQVVLGGWLLGLCSGLGLAYLREQTDATVRNERDVTRRLALPVLGYIPTLLTRSQERSRKCARILETAVFGALAVISMAVGVSSYLAG